MLFSAVSFISSILVWIKNIQVKTCPAKDEKKTSALCCRYGVSKQPTSNQSATAEMQAFVLPMSRLM